MKDDDYTPAEKIGMFILLVLGLWALILVLGAVILTTVERFI